MRTCRGPLAVLAASSRSARSRSRPRPRSGPRSAGRARRASPTDRTCRPTGTSERARSPLEGGRSGVGHSSPIVWGDRVFLTTAVPAESPALVLGDKGGIDLAADKPPISWRLLCLDARDGKLLWEREAYAGAPRAARHVKSSQANPTPVTDGKTVVALFASGTLVAYDTDGTKRWSTDLGTLNPGLLGDPKSEWGHASSPVIFETSRSCRWTGTRIPSSRPSSSRPASPSGAWRATSARCGRPRRSHTTAGRTELVVVGGTRPGLRPAHRQGDLALQGRGGGQDAHAVRERRAHDLRRRLPRPADLRDPRGRLGRRLGSRGREERPFLAWRTEPGGPYTTTPLAYRDLLYAVRDEGVLGVHDLKTGALVYRERTGTTHSASPVASDGKVYLAGEDGQLLVLRAGRTFEVLTRIDMGETVFATPAISRGTMYVRTRGHLYAISATARAAADHQDPSRQLQTSPGPRPCYLRSMPTGTSPE